MVTSSPDKDVAVADQPGASPPAHPIAPASSSLSSPSQQPTLPYSMPPPSLNCPWEPQPHVDFIIPELNNNHAFDASLSDIFRYMSALPPLSMAVPFVQPAIPPPPEMQPLMLQTQHFNQQPPAMVTMQGSEYHGYLGTTPVHAAAGYAVLPEALLPPDAAVKSASGRRRGRPPGSTAKSKPKPKVAKTTVAATTPDQEQLTEQQQQAATTSATIAWLTTGQEEELVEYANTSPPGVRFTPSDVEILGYLSRKYLGRRMPVDFIKEFNVFKDHPSTIQEECGDSINGSWYVFSPRHRKYKNGFRPTRSVGEVGFWKSNTEETAVKFKDIEIGRVNSLTFNLGRQPNGTPTPWKMKEYRIKEYQLQPNPSMLLDPWVICKLFRNDSEDQHGVPVQAGDQPDEAGEHIDASNGSGDQDNVDGNQPPNDPEQELGVEDYLAVDDFGHGDPGDQ